MPFKLRTTSLRGIGHKIIPPASDEDKALLVQSNTIPPGIRGLLCIPTDPVYKVVVLIMNLITYYCVIIDFTIALGETDYRKKMTPLREGSLRDYIFCFDFIFLVDLLLSICHKKAKMIPSRSTIVIAIDIFTFVPYDMIYIVLAGTNTRVFYGLRLRYLLRFVRYLWEVRLINRFKLSLMYVMIVYIVLSSCACMMAVCIRIHVMCNTPLEPAFNIIHCTNLTLFDIYFTYAILNTQISYSGMLFMGAPYAILNYIDGILQLCVLIISYVLIPKLICILMEKYAHKYNFCMHGHLVIKSVTGKNAGLLDDKNIKSNVANLLTLVLDYMTSYWKHYQIQNIQSTYSGNFKVATIPSVIYNEITLDITWNMFKHSLLFRNESTSFLRQVSKLTVFSFGAKNDIIYEQGMFRYSMIYIIKGIVSLLSETTGRQPLISFSGGTCFGELSLFMNIPSATTVVCRTYCEYMVLTRLNFMKIRYIYPEVYDRLRKQTITRIGSAKNYDFIATEMYKQGETKLPKCTTSMRYIKATIRTFTETHSHQSLQNTINIPHRMRPEATFSETIFNANFIPLYVMADVMESNLTSHFTLSGWNFKLKPTSTLYSIWNFVIIIFAILDNLFYPIGAAQDVDLYTSFYDYFVIILHIFYAIDFISFNFIAVMKSGKHLIDSEAILMYKIQKLHFWLDLLSCIPVEIILQIMQEPFPSYIYRIVGINRLIKIYKLLDFFQNRLFFKPKYLVFVQLAKSIFTLVMLLFLGYSTFHRFGYFDLCNLNPQDPFWKKLCIVYQFYFSMANVGMEINRDVNMLPMIILQTLASFFIPIVFCINAACFCLVYMPKVEYENKIDDLKRTFVLYKFTSGPRKKMIRFMKLHHEAGKGFYLTNKNLYMNMMGKSLFKLHRVDTYYDFISSIGFFQEMSKQTINTLCEIGTIVLVPHGEIIVTAGSLVKQVFFIMGGSCSYVSKVGTTQFKFIGRGDSIVLLEAFLGYNALNSIVAITDCQLLCVSFTELKRKLVHFPIEITFINNALSELVSKAQLNSLQFTDPHVYAAFEEGESCRYFGHRPPEKFKRDFRHFRFLHVLFMRCTITPYGRFWFSWEISHITVTYLYCFIGTIPITINYDYKDYWFWLFRSMDIFYLIDMYFRHHVVYFNKINIEVQHPWKTAKQYWKTSFAIEIISSVPLELIVLPIVDEIHVPLLCLLRINRYLRLYRFYGLKQFLNYRYMQTHTVEVLLPYIAGSLLLFNFLLLELLDSIDTVQIHEMRPVFYMDNIFLFWLNYFRKLQKAIREWSNIGIFDGFIGMEDLWRHILMNIFGLFIITSLSCVLIAMSLFRRTYLMTFQIKMQRLVQFMNIRKVDKIIRNELIKHYEYLWKLREGKSLVEVLKIFSRSVNEDIIYSYYAPTLQNTILFTDFPKVILKDILSAPDLYRLMILITGIVLRVNDVQDKIFIIYNGSVEVLGPDYSYLRELRIGSLFGCLDNVPLNRSTLTYVAKTHCEFLCIPSKTFHEILSKYPRFYRFYLKLLASSNLDYIPCLTVKGKFVLSSQTSLESHLKQKQKQVNKAVKTFAKIFPVMKRREYVEFGFTIFLTIAFHFECMLMTFLYTYFEVVVYIAYFFDVIFWIKMYIDFSTAYEDEYGLEITQRKLIAIRYIREYTGFIFHLLVNFPFEIFVLAIPTKYKYIWNLIWARLRFNRLFKIILVFKHVRSVRQRLNVNVGLVSVVDIFLILLTTQQCSIIILSHYVYFYNGIPYLSPFIMHTYFISKKMYTPYGLTVPQFTETIYYKVSYIVILVTTQLVCLHVLGQCVSTYRVKTFSRFRYETFLNNQEKVMRMMGVSPPLFQRVKSYCRNLIQQGYNVQFPNFVINAPYYLREGLLDSMFGFHLRQHPVFKRCHSDFIRQVAATFKTTHFFQGDFITFQNDIDSKIYFIHYGEVEGLIEDNLYYDVADSKYVAGDYFGFHQLISHTIGHSRTYKVVSKKATILSLKRQTVLHLLEFFPASKFIFYNCNAVNDELVNAEVEYRDYLRHTKGIHE